MALGRAICSNCGKDFLKENRYINENLKLGHNSYCSKRCRLLFRTKQVELICENPTCITRFRRQPKAVSLHNYCSRSCAAAVNNVKFPKRIAIIRNCNYCNLTLTNSWKYCSSECRSNALTISKKEVVAWIRKFYQRHGRIPVKREAWGIHKPARKYFNTWNGAIEAAGFAPNPVMFAHHQVAIDGHVCDSLAEKLIDDYLYGKNILHERSVAYPEGTYTADFKIGSKYIEYFGLYGGHRRYDELRIIKKKLAKKYKLNYVELYPKDLYSGDGLAKVLGL